MLCSFSPIARRNVNTLSTSFHTQTITQKPEKKSKSTYAIRMFTECNKLNSQARETIINLSLSEEKKNEKG